MIGGQSGFAFFDLHGSGDVPLRELAMTAFVTMASPVDGNCERNRMGTPPRVLESVLGAVADLFGRLAMWRYLTPPKCI